MSQGEAGRLTLQQRATLDDVARLAGVSPKTVSRVYSDREKVSPKTVDKVLSAAKRLRFRPNTLARSLRHGGATRTIGFIMGELQNPFYYRVAAGIEQELAQQGYTLVVATTDDSIEGEERVADTLIAQRVAALMMIPVGPDQSYLEGERHLGTPVIAIDRPGRNVMADAVVLQNRRGAYDATRSLIEHGHRKIAYLCNPATVYTQDERVAGYRQALAEAGVSDTQKWERLLDDPNSTPEAVALDVLHSADPPTAIVAGNNRMCVGVLRATRDMAEPPALIGFDDFETADVLGVTVVSHDAIEMGRRAAQLALERMADPTGATTTIELPTTLVKRGSGERPPR